MKLEGEIANEQQINKYHITDDACCVPNRLAAADVLCIHFAHDSTVEVHRMPQSTIPKVSICITTRNRGAVIGETLESILTQATDDCELVILDGGSTDNTEHVVAEYVRRSHRVRYVKQGENSGFDRDLDCVVGLARGEYCWLTSDDDLLKPGAIAAVLETLRRDLSFVVLNVEFRDFCMSRVVQGRWLEIAADRIYAPEEFDRLFADLGGRMLYVGGLVIKREIWLARRREPYYGSWFVFTGVIFAERLPGEALVMAKPLITYRMSNSHVWSPQLLKIAWDTWPSVVWSLAVSESAKQKVSSAQPWRRMRELFVYRGLGYYSLTEYRQFVRPRLTSAAESLAPVLVALLPGVLVNAVLVFFFASTRCTFHGWRQPGLMLQDLRDSPFYFRNWRLSTRASLPSQLS